MDKSRGDERYAKEGGEKELERTGDTVLSDIGIGGEEGIGGTGGHCSLGEEEGIWDTVLFDDSNSRA
jgi:hypothetical protein